MKYVIRELRETEYHLLNDFLYEAIYIPEGAEAPPKSMIDKPELQIYTEQFGKDRADYALAAESNGSVVGAVWVRIMDDYGHVDENTPSLAISLYKQYRDFGIGTALMKEMILHLKERGCKRVSLAVQKENYALKMYQKAGFKIVGETVEEYIMVKNL